MVLLSKSGIRPESAPGAGPGCPIVAPSIRAGSNSGVTRDLQPGRVLRPPRRDAVRGKVRHRGGPDLLIEGADAAITRGQPLDLVELPITFTTSEFGAPVADPGDLVGRSWEGQLTDATWTEPAGAGSLVPAQVDEDLLLGVINAAGSQLDLRYGGVGIHDTEQDPDLNTADALGVDFSLNPRFSAPPQDIAVEYGGVTSTAYGVVTTGVFSPSGDSIGGLSLSATLDTAPFSALLTDDGSPDAVCQTAASFGVSCIDCPDGLPYCVALRAEEIPAEELPGVSTDPVGDGTGAACSVVSASMSLGWIGLLLVSWRRAPLGH